MYDYLKYLAGNILKKVRKFNQKRVTLSEDEMEDCSNLLKGFSSL